MKNAGLAGAIALCGIGLMMIGLGNFVKAPTAMAYTPAVAAAVQDNGEPTIVWYGTISPPAVSANQNYSMGILIRAWSDGTVEGRSLSWEHKDPNGDECGRPDLRAEGWRVLSSPTEGLNAAADITFDEVVDGQDLTTLLASWGEAPRNPMPPSDCPLGLMN